MISFMNAPKRGLKARRTWGKEARIRNDVESLGITSDGVSLIVEMLIVVLLRSDDLIL
jgi:hypothetical protein